MPRLYLLRHVKAVAASPGMADFDRPIAARGRDAAAALSLVMAERGYMPALVLCSSALRTRQTFAGILPAFVADTAALFLRSIFDLGGTYLPLVAGRGGEADSLMIVGHNPAIQATAVTLAGGGDAAALTRLADKYPTGGLAVIDLDAPFAAVAPGAGRLVDFVVPDEAGDWPAG